MKPLTIYRTINGQEVEIELTMAEMCMTVELVEIGNCAEDIQEQYELIIPEEELEDAARSMYELIYYYGYSHDGALDTVCGDFGFDEYIER